MNGNVNFKNIANTVSTNKGEGQKIAITVLTPDRINKRQNGKNNILQINNPSFSQQRVYDPNGISPTIAAGNNGGGKEPCKILQIKNATKKGYQEAYVGDGVNLEHPDSKTRRGRVQPGMIGALQCSDARGVVVNEEFYALRWVRTEKGKLIRKEAMKNGKDYTPFNNGCRTLAPAKEDVSGTITSKAIAKDSLLGNGLTIRKLTPTECFRLMGFLDDEIYLEGLSNSQRYKLAGNGWDINLVSKIFKEMFKSAFEEKDIPQ
jgi:DNA (cytosine-5)-methyltransferase 1